MVKPAQERKKRPKNYPYPLSLRLTAATMRALGRIAHAEDRPKTYIVRRALQTFCRKHDPLKRKDGSRKQGMVGPQE